MQVDTSVAEADVGKLIPGMATTFTVDAFPGDRFKGTVRQIRNAATMVQNVVTYDAVIDVENQPMTGSSDFKLRPGMTANVTFIYDHRDSALRVANAALRFQPPPELARAAWGGGGGGAHGGGGQRAGGQRAGGGPPGEGGGQRRMGGGRAGGAAGGEPPDRRMLWVLRGPTPTPVRVRAGVSDGTNTEIETSELHEGDRVVTDAEVSNSDNKGQPAGAGAFRRMF
jgi:HlyD family secretion protein